MKIKNPLLYEGRVGARLYWRNKSSSILGLTGIILVSTIIGTIFLISSNQVRTSTLGRLQKLENPITVTAPTTAGQVDSNLIEEIAHEIQVIDSQNSGKLTKIHYILQIKALYAQNHSYVDSVLFPIINGSVNWTGLNIHSPVYRDLKIIGDNLPSLQNFKELSYNSLHNITMQGQIPINANEIMISELFSEAFSIHINETIDFGYNGTGSISTGYKITGIYSKPFWYPGFFNMNDFHCIYMNYSTMKRLLLDLNGSTLTFPDLSPLWGDGGVINLLVDTNTFRITNINSEIQEISQLAYTIEREIQRKGYNNYIVSNQLAEFLDPIWQVKEAFNSLGYILTFLSLVFPIIILAVYFSYLLTTEILEKRKQQFAQLRSKGFNKNQLKHIVAPEILLSAPVVTILASILGIAVSYGFNGFIQQFSYYNNDIASTFNPFNFPEDLGWYLIIVFVTSLLLTSLVYRKPLMQIQNAELIHHLIETPEEETDTWEKRSILLLIVGLIPIAIEIVFIISGQTNMIIYTTFYENLISVLLCLSPFLIGLFLLNLVTKKFPLVLSKSMLAFIPKLSNSVRYWVSKKITLRSAKIGRLMVLLLFTIGFSIMASVANNSINLKFRNDGAIYQGSDLKINGKGGFNASINLLNDLSTFEDISSFSPALKFSIWTNYPDIEYMELIKFESLYNTSRLNIDDYLIDTNMEYLRTHSINQTISLAPNIVRNDINIGDIVAIDVPLNYFNGPVVTPIVIKISSVIGGYYKAIPGLVPLKSNIDHLGEFNPLIIDMHPFNFINASTIGDRDLTILIKLDSADQNNILRVKQVLSNNVSTSLKVSSLDDSIDFQIRTSSLSTLNAYGFFDMLSMDTWFMFGISISCVIILVISRITIDKREMALIRIKGFNHKQVSQIYIIEYFMPVVIAMLWGLTCGLFSGWILAGTISQSFALFQPSFHTIAPLGITIYDIMILTVLPLAIFLIIIVFLVTSESRRNLSNILTKK